MDAQSFNNMSPKILDFGKIKKPRKILLNPQTFLFLFYIVQRGDAHRWSHNEKLKQSPNSLHQYISYLYFLLGLLNNCKNT